MKNIYFFDDTHSLSPFAYAMEANTHPAALPPLNSLPMAPRLGEDGHPLPGEWPCANTKHDGWIYVEDHRPRKDAQGRQVEGSGTPYWLPVPYGDDTHVSPARYMTDIGPLPEGAQLTRPEKTQAEKDAERKAEIMVELTAIDARSARPLRAIAAGTASDDDRAAVTTLEWRAETLRNELATLEPVGAA